MGRPERQRGHAPGKSELQYLRNVLHLSYADIADRYGISVSGVKAAARRYGLTRDNVSTTQHLPWTIERDHQDAYPLRRLRIHFRIEAGEAVPDDEINKYVHWVARLRARDHVVDYDPEVSPNDLSSVGGFYSRPRRDSDGPEGTIIAHPDAD